MARSYTWQLCGVLFITSHQKHEILDESSNSLHKPILVGSDTYCYTGDTTHFLITVNWAHWWVQCCMANPRMTTTGRQTTLGKQTYRSRHTPCKAASAKYFTCYSQILHYRDIEEYGLNTETYNHWAASNCGSTRSALAGKQGSIKLAREEIEGQ